MAMPRRRYEVLLPTRYDDGRDVEPRKLYDSKEELMAQFGGMIADGIVRTGSWKDSHGVRYDDETIRLTVDIDDTNGAITAIRAYKSTLIDRFRQKEIYIVSWAIEVE
jgi:hypothetical protein